MGDHRTLRDNTRSSRCFEQRTAFTANRLPLKDVAEDSLQLGCIVSARSRDTSVYHSELLGMGVYGMADITQLANAGLGNNPAGYVAWIFTAVSPVKMVGKPGLLHHWCHVLVVSYTRSSVRISTY